MEKAASPLSPFLVIFSPVAPNSRPLPPGDAGARCALGADQEAGEPGIVRPIRSQPHDLTSQQLPRTCPHFAPIQPVDAEAYFPELSTCGREWAAVGNARSRGEVGGGGGEGEGRQPFREGKAALPLGLPVSRACLITPNDIAPNDIAISSGVCLARA